MSKPEWGVKRTCPSCSARFYDMQRQPIVCPKCSNSFDPEAFVKKRRGRPPSSESKSLQKPKPEEVMDLSLEEDLTTLDEGDDILEDTSDFGEDEEVVGLEKSTDEE